MQGVADAVAKCARIAKPLLASHVPCAALSKSTFGLGPGLAISVLGRPGA